MSSFSQIGPYIIKRTISEGSFGLVYEVQSNAKVFALKLLKVKGPSADKKVNLSECLREASFLACLHHPNVVSFLDVGQHDDSPYLVMEYLVGTPLNELLKKTTLTTQEAIDYAKAICNALIEIHVRGILHRDIKPSNIFITESNELKVIDFGLAISAKTQTGIDSTNSPLQFAGTISFSSPEQIGIIQRAIDERSDLYSLGVVLYLLLTNQLPFVGDSVDQVIQQHLSKTPIPPHQISPDIPERLSKLVMALLSKDPDERYQSALGLLKDLESFSSEYSRKTDLELPHRLTLSDDLSQNQIIGHSKVLESVLKGINQGSGRSLFAISGELGMGKSTLIKAIAQKLNDGAKKRNIVFIKGTKERTTFYEFWRLIKSEAHRLMTAQPTEHQQAFKILSLLEQKWELESLNNIDIKEIKSQLTIGSIDKSSDLTRLRELLSSSIQQLTEMFGPLVFIIDDFHLLNDDLQESLISCLENIKSTLSIIASVCQNLRIFAQRTNSASQINFVNYQLEKFDEQETVEFVRSLMGGKSVDSQILIQISSISKGNPLLVRELVRSMMIAGLVRPTVNGWKVNGSDFKGIGRIGDVDKVLRERIKYLSPEKINLISILAVFGVDFDLSLAVSVCGCSQLLISNAIQSAIELGLILKKDSKNYCFSINKIRSIFLEALSSHDARVYHLKIARAIQCSHSQTDHFKIAHHSNVAGDLCPPEEAFNVNYSAGKYAISTNSIDLALQFLGEADLASSRFELPTETKFDLAKTLGFVTARKGNFEEALDHFHFAISHGVSKNQRAEIFYEIAVVYATQGKNKEAWRYLKQALAEYAVSFSVSPVVRSFRLISDWLFGYIYFSVPALKKTKLSKEDERAVVNMAHFFELTSALCFFDGKFFRFFESVIREFLISQSAVGNFFSRAMSHSSYATLFGLLNIRPASRLHFSLSAANAAGSNDQELMETCDAFFHIARVWYGESIEATTEIEAKLSHYQQSLSSWTYIKVLASVVYTYVTRGYSQRVIDLARQNSSHIKSTNCLMHTANIKGAAYSQLVIMGKLDEAQAMRREWIELVDQLPNTIYAFSYKFIHELHVKLELGEVDRLADKEISAFLNLHFDEYYNRYAFIIIAYIRVLQYRQCNDPLIKKDLLLKIEKQILKVSIRSWTKVHRCHFYLLKGIFCSLNGDYTKADLLFDKAEIYSNKEDSIWGKFLVNLERARMEIRRGGFARSQVEAKKALSIASENGWRLRYKMVQSEFNLESEPVKVENAFTGSMTSRLINVREKQYGEALMRISLAMTNLNDEKELCRSALDEAIRILGAERAFLFDIDEHTNELKLVMGRDFNGADFLKIEDFCHAVVKKTFKNNSPCLQNIGDSKDEEQTQKSMHFHHIRSAIATPVNVKGTLKGVIYFDNKLIKGVFGERDIEFVQSIANQVGLVRSISEMVKQTSELNLLESRLNRFLPANIVSDVIKGNVRVRYEPSVQDVTIIFTDLVNFTGLMAKTHSVISGKILNEFLDRMINVIFEYNGTIDKFIGDAILIIYGAPLKLEPEQQVSSAIACVMKMFRELKFLNDKWRQEYSIDPIEMRVGIHRGPAIIGNFGNEQRTEYTAIGNTVNLASRLHGSALPGQTFVTDSVASLIPKNSCKYEGEFEFKGVAEKIICYSLLYPEDSQVLAGPSLAKHKAS